MSRALANCPTRGPWLRNSLRHRAREMKSMATRCRKAFTRPFMIEAAEYLAAAYDQAAAVFERALVTLEQGKNQVEPVHLGYHSWSNAPGYRDVWVHGADPVTGAVYEVHLDKNVSLALALNVLGVHELAWSDSGPIDREPGEERPPLPNVDNREKKP